MNHPTGTFDGEVVNAYLDTAYGSEDDLDAIFEVATEHGMIKCKHPLYDKGGVQDSTLDRTKDVLLLFGVQFPDGIEEIDNLGNRDPQVKVSVWVGEYNGKPYGKINTGRSSAKADPEKIAAAVARLKGDPSVPF